MPQPHLLPQSGPNAPRIEFIDMAFTADDEAQVLGAIRDRDPAAPFAYIVTPNVDHIVRLQRSRSDLWPAYRAAWMTLCDSRILARLASLSGLPLPVLPGSDLTVRMIERVIVRDDHIAIIGGGAERVAALADRYGLRAVAHHEPPMGFIDDPEAVERAARFAIEARARYHIFALGSPQQEMLAYRIARMGGATGTGLCVGASLDFLTGVQTRAPASMQRLSMEWLYRLGGDPRRLWRRYLVDGPEIFGIARNWLRTARERRNPLPRFPNIAEPPRARLCTRARTGIDAAMERPEAKRVRRRRRRTPSPMRRSRRSVMLGIAAIAAIAIAAHAAPRLIGTPSSPDTAAAPIAAPPPPTRIGLNLFGLNDYYRQQVFTNLIAQSEWFSSRGQGWTAMPADQLDANGWVRFLRPGQTAPRTLTVPPAPLRPAQVRCTWRGRGTLDTGGIARTITTGPRELTLQLTPIGGEEERGWIELRETDPADPIRDIDCRESGRPANERFHPEFIEFLRGFAVLRFLDWQRTNDNFAARWAMRSTPASSSQVAQPGASIEDMVDLANRVGADPWFLMPYRADADYVRAFAQAVHARIDPARTVYIELGNEVWNDQFEAARQARDEGLAAGLGGGDPTRAQAMRYAQKLCPVMAIWRDVFADRPGRLVRVAASHNANPESARVILGHGKTADCVDALATAPYIWIDLEGQRVSDPKWVFDRMPAAIDDVFAFAHRNRAIAAEFGKRFIAYEGGQHLVTRDVEFARRVQRDPLMGATYRAYLERWRREMGDDLVLYASTAPIGEYGAWGLREYAGQPTNDAPKLEAVRAFLKAHP